MIAALLLALSAIPPGPCAPATLRADFDAAMAAADHDLAAAKQAIAPAAACPVKDGLTYDAHVLRADLALREEDWATARAMLTNVGVHPEAGLSARAGFIRLRADQGLGDAEAFAADRAALLAANARVLLARGRELERFRAGAAEVVVYRAELDQRAFHRVVEFMIVPDNPRAYPAAIHLTDDRGAAAMMGQMEKDKGAPPPAHAWFVDLYTCPGHATLAPIGNPGGDEPAYAAVKARVIQTLEEGHAAAVTEAPGRGSCPTGGSILPGLGAR